jgi:outer membrane protein TolC
MQILPAILLPLLLAVPASAPRADATQPRTLEDYLSLARGTNPEVKAAEFKARAAGERVGVETGYPDPMLMYGFFAAPKAMQGRQEVELRQGIPFPGKRGLRGAIAARDEDAMRGMADALVLDVDFAVRSAFFEYVRTAEVANVLEEERALLVRMRDIARVRYEAGTAEQQEVLKLELAISQLDDESSMNEHEQDRHIATLNQLIGRHAHSPLPIPEWVMPDPSRVVAAANADTAIARRPEVAAAQAASDAADARRRLARREYLPDFTLGVMYEFGADQDGTWELLAGVNLPIWLGQRRARVREAEAMQQSAGYQLQAERLAVRRDVEDALHAIYNAQARLERFQRLILPQAEQSFRSSEVGYRAGRVDFMNYLDSQRMLLAMRKEYYGVIADLGIQIAALERAMANETAKE